MDKYFDPIFSKYHFGFRKGCNKQECLLIMIKKWKTSLYQNETCAALLADLFKAFACLPHHLVVAKVCSLVAIFHHLNFLTAIYVTDTKVLR